jgi:HEAT repeat protein
MAAMAMTPFAVAVAQTPPTPPTPVVTPVTPVLPSPAVAPVPLIPDWIDREEIRRLADEARRLGEDARIQGRISAEDARRLSEEGRRLGEEGRLLAQHAAEEARIAMKDARIDLHNFDFNFATPMAISGNAFAYAPAQGLLAPRAQQWQDPADSAYNAAREIFSRQDYSRAAAKFAEVQQKYPNSRQVAPAAYYQAFSLYRVGTLEALRTGLKVLETNAQQFQYGNSSLRTQSLDLQARVLRALQERNEPSAEAKLRDLISKNVASYPGIACDQEKMQIQQTVLSSLQHTDPDAAMVYIRQYLQTRDACNAPLRRTALSLLRNRPSPENTATLVSVARNDTVRSVRQAAIEALSSMPGDDAINALQQLMQDNDEYIQNAAVRSLMRSNNPRARSAMRTLIDRRDAKESQRIEAIRSFDRDNTSAEDAAYLRNLFNRQGESDRVKEAIIYVLGQVPNDENMKFLLDVAQNQNESSYVRSSAFRRVTARGNLSTDNIIRLYDATDSRSMRQSLVEALGQRPEQAAVNKLLDIVKLSTDPEVRSNAIQILLRKKDPKITEQVLALIK